MVPTANNEVVVKDACIFFDLIDMGLLADFYELGLTVITTPQVIDEVKDEQQLAAINVYIANGKLQIDHFGQLETIVAVLDTAKGLGFTDASVIEAAMRRQAVILSSDKSLRNEAGRRHIVVRGMLWILEQLYEQGIANLTATLAALTRYSEVNVRAPKSEIETLIAKLKQQNSA